MIIIIMIIMIMIITIMIIIIIIIIIITELYWKQLNLQLKDENKQLVIFTILNSIFENIYTIKIKKLNYMINYYNSNNSDKKIMLIPMLTIVTSNLTTLRISVKNSVILTSFKPYIRRYLQRLNNNNNNNNNYI